MSQHRLCRVQLVNWGTFDGARAFAVPRRGLLLTGPSGAGKSSILDAMASILVRPAKLKFNSAAQGTETGDRERSLVTYVLGAYKRETDSATGEIGTAFLRKGPTWSGVALTFDDGRGVLTTLIRLFHLRGGTTSGQDLKSMYILAPEAVDLLSLASFVKDGIENRRVQQAFPHWDCFSNDAYTGFSGKFRRRLGLGSEQAQLLLHKTQSAKNLTNLDSLFREFMLDAPGTFDLADDTVAQFEDLSLAHAAVVDARLQVEALNPLRSLGAEHDAATAALASIADEQQHLATWLTARGMADADQSLAVERPRFERLDAELGRAVDALADLDALRIDAQRAVDGSAGAQVATLEELIGELDVAITRMEDQRTALAADATLVGLAWPESDDDLPAFEAALRDAAARFEAGQSDHQNAVYAAMERRGGAKARIDGIDGELAALRRHGSNLDERLLGARQLIAETLQVAETTLPFVGELLQVRPDDAAWTGAIERVLGGLARTLVVPERHYLAASEVIDDQFLRTRLVYERVSDAQGPGSTAEPGVASLVRKVELTQGPYEAWLDDRLRRRFDYACVESAAEFGRHERAVTRAGQVKHSASLHEKDDRRGVDDRSRWVLGFTTEAKEAELERLRGDALADFEQAQGQLAALDRAGASRTALRAALDRLERISWPDLDAATPRRRRQVTQDRLAQLRREHTDMPKLEADLARATRAVAEAEEGRRRLATARDKCLEYVTSLEARREALRLDLAAAPPVPTEVGEALDARASDLGVPFDRLEAQLNKQLSERRLHEQSRQAKAAKDIARLLTHYQQRWPAQSADWNDEVAYLPEALERLTSLEFDGLPEFEQRFFDLLQNQARNNISQLSLQIRGARREIRARVGEVNKSLGLTEFSPGGYLQIDVKDRALPDVETFLASLQAITSGSALDMVVAGDQDRTAAEQRFTLMKGVLDRLGSSDPADKAWRDRCLDTRQHVQFQARVQDADGTQLDVFTGSGGRSGGERQKLVTFCLAAALRFQLAPAGQTQPSYALVVIDEAFDKADHSFTQAGLEVFKRFGFQLLLATPMKMLQTIDDYVGGVVMVTNDSGNGSQVQELPFDADDDAPDKLPTTPVETQEALV